jgi:hypothetical protein
MDKLALGDFCSPACGFEAFAKGLPLRQAQHEPQDDLNSCDWSKPTARPPSAAPINEQHHIGKPEDD